MVCSLLGRDQIQFLKRSVPEGASAGGNDQFFYVFPAAIQDQLVYCAVLAVDRNDLYAVFFSFSEEDIASQNH